MSINWSSFLPTLLATLFGVGIAFLLNGIYNYKIERIQARKLLFLLKDEIKSNYDLLIELERELKTPNYIPFYDLRFVIWNSIPSNITKVLKKPNIMKDIAKFYFELQHIERKINGIFNITFNPNITTNTMSLRQTLVNSLNQHIPGVLIGKNCKSPKELICEINYLMIKLI